MAAESSFQTLKMKPSSSEKTTFSNKVEQRAVIKFCVDIGKTPTETHKFIKQSVTHSNVSRSLVFKWHKRFSDGRGSLMDDKREGRPSFKTSDVVKNEVCNVIDGDRHFTVREVADKCVISKTTQASTLTYFSTCPFGQITKKSTCPTQSFSCPKKLIKITKN